MTKEKHARLPVELASKFINNVKEAIINVADRMNIVIGDDFVHPIEATEMIHEDRFDMYGDYGCVELRVYWKE